MERILKVNLIQHSINQNDLIVFVRNEYENLFNKINNELKNIFYSVNSEITIENYLEKNYLEIAKLAKYIIYSNLPLSNWNKEYNLKINFFHKKKDTFIESINLRLNDMVTMNLNLVIRFNKNFYLNFKFKNKDREEIFDIISRNYWFEKREKKIFNKC